MEKIKINKPEITLKPMEKGKGVGSVILGVFYFLFGLAWLFVSYMLCPGPEYIFLDKLNIATGLLGTSKAVVMIVGAFLMVCGIEIIIFHHENRADSWLYLNDLMLLLAFAGAFVYLFFTITIIAFFMLILIVPSGLLLLIHHFMLKKRNPQGLTFRFGWLNILSIFLMIAIGGILSLAVTHLSFNDIHKMDEAFYRSEDFKSFMTVDMNGNTVTEEIFKGHKITLINYWSTTCGPCITEMPGLEEISRESDPAMVQIIGLCGDLMNPNYQLDEAAVAKAITLIDQTGVTYPNLFPSKALYTGVLSHTLYTPTTFVVNESGEIIDIYYGAQEKEDWADIIEKSLLILEK